MSALSPEPCSRRAWAPGQSGQTDALASTVAFGAWDQAVHVHTQAKLLERLATDCKIVFTAKQALGSEHSSGATFWIAAGAAPRCLLEQLALAILAAHAPPGALTCDASGSAGGVSRVGVEWWTLAIDAEDSSVGFHWDLDYEAEDRLHVHRTPFAATVTYLCSSGVPTLVLEKVPTPGSRAGPSEDGFPVERGWLSVPAPGKHIRFNGAWLHGAPDLKGLIETHAVADGVEQEAGAQRVRGRKHAHEPKPSKSKGRKVRVSLLVNVWLDGAPGYAAPLGIDMASKLSPCLARVPFSLEKSSPAAESAPRRNPTTMTESARRDCKRSGGTYAEQEARQEKRECSWPVSTADSSACKLKLHLPANQRVAAGATLPLSFLAGEAALVW